MSQCNDLLCNLTTQLQSTYTFYLSGYQWTFIFRNVPLSNMSLHVHELSDSCYVESKN